jgi:D-3-phosphoglycerate dehydrogenase
VPLNPATKGYINDELFSYMKDGVRIINLSRGEVVDNAAMLKALESGKVAKYVTDFPSAEVLEMPNTVCIPHLGASTPESENNCAYMAAAQLKNYIEYGVIKNSVNLPEVDTMPDCKYRICMIHENIPNMISQLTTALGDAGVNIEHLTNKSKKDMAYSIVDTNDDLPADLEAKVSAVEGILKVRVIAY